MPERVRMRVNGSVIEAESGTSVLAALWNAGVRTVRSSVTGEGRGALCAMGACHECRVTIDGAAHRRSCLEVVREGMEVRTGG
jgi:sarcosine oxidase subunit alpha